MSKLYKAVVEIEYYLQAPFDIPDGELRNDKFLIVTVSENWESAADIAFNMLLEQIADKYVQVSNTESRFKRLDVASEMVVLHCFNIYDDMQCSEDDLNKILKGFFED